MDFRNFSRLRPGPVCLSAARARRSLEIVYLLSLQLRHEREALPVAMGSIEMVIELRLHQM